MFADLDEFFDPDLLLPIGGKSYRVGSPTAREGLRLRRRLLDGEPLTDTEELAEIEKLLGDAFAEMARDGVSWPEIMRAGRTALMFYGVSHVVAEQVWGGGDTPGNPLPPEPIRWPGATACAAGSAAAR